MDAAPTAPTTATADVAIVGAGAAGLAAAIFAAEAAPRASVVVLDGAKKIGAKILVSGGGRCNVTHHEVAAADFNGTQPIVRNVLAAFGVAATVDWFAGMGVTLKREETGKLFPVSDKAASVVSALVGRCQALGVTLLTDHRILDVTHRVADASTSTAAASHRVADASHRVADASHHIADAAHRIADATPNPAATPALLLHHARGTLAAHRVVLATGGRSLPKSGSDGQGWEIVARLGHTVTPTHQALVPLVFAEGTPFAALAGVSHDAELATFAGGKRVDQRRGSLLWTHVGISGPVVMDASRHWVIAAANGARPELRLNVYPGEDFDAVDRRLTAIATARPKLSLLRVLGEHLAEHMPERAAATLVRLAEFEPALPNARLTRGERRRLVHTLTALPLPVERARGWNYAEVTAGGVPLAEVDYRTMASRIVPGLHLIGEMLDCDGRIGGFNFQWAWATGHLAGRAAARAIAEQESRA